MPDSGTESEIEWAKLEKGNTATDWSPAPEDLGTKSELEKIKQAIIDLGGSI
ncbi:hypothetical protein TMUPMC115_0264 [Tetragenococcus muriaticus PMC-11-5]|uniref:Uncharacterized protein n=1 Tax=Tetragenococcus muriaticus PMC-11-5 TaxID=1302649 RepID=A0A091C723_9ENTE|nr:hypothetical protein [Tetragenococcus muriaticus]KFN93666.1 hypothetical protein TMUPMC115_0264 [Tetragenococcus muriaticus PMC-11-5]